MFEQYFNVTKIGNNICVRGFDDGKYINTKIKYAPYVYIQSLEDTGFKSINGLNLKRKDLPSMSDLWQYQNQTKKLQIDLYGMDNSVCAYMNDNLSTDFDPAKIRVFYLDIENYMKDKDGNIFGIDPIGAHGAITAITIYDTITETYHVFGDGMWDDSKYSGYKVEYHHCDNEFELLVMFMKYWVANYPHIVTGWNVDGYDIPYLYNRIKRVLGDSAAKRLSPWNKITFREYVNEYHQDATEYTFAGISVVDYKALYKKNTFHKQESYSLDYIAYAELGKGKFDYHELGYKDLDDLYDRNYQDYVTYNVRDIESLVQIDDKNKFMDIVTGVAYYALVNFDEVNSPIRCWDSLKHQYLKQNNIITSPRSNNTKSKKFKGAYVKEPVPRLYRWVMVFDLASLYPSIIITCNVGNETIVPEDEVPDGLMVLYNKDLTQLILDYGITKEQTQLLVDNDMTLSANGMFYYNTTTSIQSILSNNILKERKIYKGRMLDAKTEYEATKSTITDPVEHKRYQDIISANDNRQMVTKVLANAMFGGMGNKYDRYFDVRLAESVTLTGRTVIKWAEQKVNGYFNTVMNTTDVPYCVYSDTDSCGYDSVIYVDGKEITIGDFYKSIDIIPDSRGIKSVSDKKALSYSLTNNNEYKPIKYVYEHEINKEMFLVEISGKSVEITADHSIVVKRNNKLVSVTVNTILEGDEIIYLNRYNTLIKVKTGKNFKITSLGIQKRYVYDLEVEDNHNFFANNILLHNSIFLNLEAFVEAIDLPDDDQKTTDFLVKVGEVVNKKLAEYYDELGAILNSNNNRLLMKREAIASTTIFRKKKNYAMKVLDNEGVRFSPDDPYYKIMGIEVVKASTPKVLRSRLKTALTMMLNDCTKFELYDFFEEVRADYLTYTTIEDIAFPKGTTDIDKYVNDVVGGKLYKGKCPIHVRGSIIFNDMYATTAESKIVSGEDVRYTYLKLPNPTHENVISIKDGFPDELRPYIDYNTNFNKLFKKPIESLSRIIGYEMNDTPSLLDF